jgi:uncharacterized protein (DUF697 family)
MSDYPKYCRDKAKEELPKMIGIGAASSAVPLPGAFTVGTTAVQLYLVKTIAEIYGVNIEELPDGVKGVVAAILALGIGSTVGKIAGEAASFIPIIGWMAKPAIGAATTKLFGESTIKYFESIYPDKVYIPQKGIATDKSPSITKNINVEQRDNLTNPKKLNCCNCPDCGSIDVNRNGDLNGKELFQCNVCGKNWV